MPNLKCILYDNVMNQYGKLYKDDMNIHIEIVEGIYESNNIQKARVLGDVNIKENLFSKFLKQPYNVINLDETTITLKKHHYDIETNIISYEYTYTILDYLLLTQGYDPLRIEQIKNAVKNMSNDKNIRINQDSSLE